MKTIKYIGYYDLIDSSIQRNCVLAATNKMDYIINALNEIGYNVQVVSASECVDKINKYYQSQIVQVRDNFSVRFAATFGCNLRLLRPIRRWFTKANFFLWILFNIRKGEQVIVYHSVGYSRLIMWAKKIKKFQLILEVEEIYQDAQKLSKRIAEAEYKLFSFADKFIFPTTLLDKKLNDNEAPSIIIHGTYKVELSRNLSFDDGKIHIVYAGTFDFRKGGAVAAITATRYLSDNYHMHIIGFGNDNDVRKVEKMINDVALVSQASISMDGLLKGDDYINFLQKCHIGLSTQDPSAIFNATSFPSKILSYMANGLRVVSIDISVVKESVIGNYMFYYEQQTPEDIAKAILSINLDEEYDGRLVIGVLNNDFKSEMNCFMKK